MSKLRDLSATYSSQLSLLSPELQKKAMTSYKFFANELKKAPVAGNQIMQNADRLITRISPLHVGRLCLFYYDPKLKKELPYYDRFPLVMPLQGDQSGFLGLNFHYLPHKQRAMLLDALDQFVIRQKHYSEKKRIAISYQIMKRAIRTPLYIPTIKRYLYSHLRSRIYVLEPDTWNFTLFLPLERFDKASMGRVHIDSLRKVRTYGSF